MELFNVTTFYSENNATADVAESHRTGLMQTEGLFVGFSNF